MQPICNEREPLSKAAIVRSENIVRNMIVIWVLFLTKF